MNNVVPTYMIDWREGDQWDEWRWFCGCGSHGRWQGQSPDVADLAGMEHLAAKHGYIDPRLDRYRKTGQWTSRT